MSLDQIPDSNPLIVVGAAVAGILIELLRRALKHTDEQAREDERRKEKSIAPPVSPPPPAMSNEITTMWLELHRMNSDLSAVQSDNAALRSEIVSLRNDRQELRHEIEELRRENSDLRDRLVLLEDENHELHLLLRENGINPPRARRRPRSYGENRAL